jgi:hypothetical protein
VKGCDTPSILFKLEEVLVRLKGVEVADGQPLCVECGRLMRRQAKRHEKWSCVCGYWLVVEFLWLEDQ